MNILKGDKQNHILVSDQSLLEKQSNENKKCYCRLCNRNKSILI